MTELEDVVPIIFPPGYFGHYLHWVLDNFTEMGHSRNIDKLPFNIETGSSHKLSNHPTEQNWEIFINCKKYSKFEILHQWINHNCFTDVDLVSTSVKQCIVINPTSKFAIAPYNMLYDKTDIKFNPRIMLHEDVVNDVDYDNDPKYDIREFLSYKLFHTKIFSSSCNYTNNVCSVELYDLLYNFEKVIKKILLFLDTSLICHMDLLLENHKKMISFQRHLTKDKDIEHFLNCFKKRINSNIFNNISIIDEAYIQKYLRDELNLEIKCFGLNEFPKTTSELRKITYPAEELVREE